MIAWRRVQLPFVTSFIVWPFIVGDNGDRVWLSEAAELDLMQMRNDLNAAALSCGRLSCVLH